MNNETPKKQIHQDVYIGIACAALCVVVFFMNHDLPGGAGSMPLLLDAILAVLSVVIFIGGLKKSSLPAEKRKNEEKAFSIDAVKIPLIFWVIVAAYVGLFYVAGYFIATAVMMIVMMLFMKRRDWLKMVIIDVIFLVIMYFVFVRMLGVNIDGFGLIGRLF